MSEFNGFPTRMSFTPVPNLVFSTLFPLITDITELKVLFHIFEIIYLKKGVLRFTSYNELLGYANLAAGLKVDPQKNLKEALDSLTRKGILLHLVACHGEGTEDLYFINTESNKQAVEKIRRGERALPGMEAGRPIPAVPPAPADIFTLYEQNIGMLTPLIADELREAEKQYPETWIREAVKEAVSLNKRNWRYIARILEHWSSEGKGDGTYRRHSKKNTDPDRFFRGKYGHMVH